VWLPRNAIRLIDITARYQSFLKEWQRADTPALRAEYRELYLRYLIFKRGELRGYFEETPAKGNKRGRPRKT
jgi:hypothetical protein